MADAENTRVKSVLEDPSTQAIAQTYAVSFLDAAGDDAAAAVEEFSSFLDVLDSNGEFETLFLSGIMNRDEQAGIIERVAAKHGSELFAGFLNVLADHSRLELLRQIYGATLLEHEKRTGRQRVQVVSAQPLDDAALERVRSQIDQSFDFDPILEPETDSKLIGGLVIRVGNTVYDGSLRSRLTQLAKRLDQGTIHAIQSGRDRFSTD